MQRLPGATGMLTAVGGWGSYTTVAVLLHCVDTLGGE